jgi:hypothetical protein
LSRSLCCPVRLRALLTHLLPSSLVPRSSVQSAQCCPARLRGALKAPPSLVARSSLLSPLGAAPFGSRGISKRCCVVPLASGFSRSPQGSLDALPSLLARSSLVGPVGAAPLGSRGEPFACGVPGVFAGTRVSSSGFDVGERPCPGNVLMWVTHTRIKRDGGHAATMRSRQGRARPIQPGPAPVR